MNYIVFNNWWNIKLAKANLYPLLMKLTRVDSLLVFCTFSAGGIVSQHVRPIFFFGNVAQLTKMSRRTIGTQKMSIMYVQVLHLPFFALWLAFTYDFDGWRACNIHICTIKIRFSKVWRPGKKMRSIVPIILHRNITRSFRVQCKESNFKNPDLAQILHASQFSPIRILSES